MSTPYPVPVGRTSRRITWPHLPAPLRAAIERRCGSPVVETASMGAGYTPGFASVLTCEDGSRVFVKAASTAAQRTFADAYREEGRKLALLPPDAPAARLLWSIDSDWVVLGIEYVEGRAPRRPWRAEDLTVALDGLERVADLLTPVDPALAPDTFAEEHASFPGLWSRLTDLPHAEEAAALAAGFAEVTAGETLVHTDLRDDNVILTGEDAVFCDWNWPVRGAAWIDTVMMLIGPRGDGLDVERVLAERRLTRDLPAEHVDALLALLTGYFLVSATQPVPASSPHLRDHQRWQGEVCWAWLTERRGWS